MTPDELDKLEQKLRNGIHNLMVDAVADSGATATGRTFDSFMDAATDAAKIAANEINFLLPPEDSKSVSLRDRARALREELGQIERRIDDGEE